MDNSKAHQAPPSSDNKGIVPILFAGVTLVVAAAVIGGIIVMGGPSHQREIRLDELRLQRIQSLSRTMESYYMDTHQLPKQLTEVETWQQSHLGIPFDPEWIRDPGTDQPFEYHILSDTRYELCTVFSTDSPKQEYNRHSLAIHPDGYHSILNKPHQASYQCYTFQVKKEKS